MKRALLVVLPLLLLSACIDVGDLGKHWGKGLIDKNITGTWVSQNAKSTPEEGTLYFKAEGDVMLAGMLKDAGDAKKTLKARSFAQDGCSYLMLRDYKTTSDNGKAPGALIRYALTDGNFVTYDLTPAFQEAAADGKTFTHIGTKGEKIQRPIVHALADDDLKTLCDPKFWQIDQTFKRVK